MKEYIEERAIQIANYIIDENATVRQTAKRFGISKSTVHKDVAIVCSISILILQLGPGSFLISTRRSAISAADLRRKRSTSMNTFFRHAARRMNNDEDTVRIAT